MQQAQGYASPIALTLALIAAGWLATVPAASASPDVPVRPQGPCDIYAAAGAPCVAAHSTTRALYAGYHGPLYQVLRQSDGKTLNIGVVEPKAGQAPDAGGYADAAAQDAFCADTYCWISILYDQSDKHNDLVQAPRGYFHGPSLGGFNNLPVADLAPVTVMGHKVYGLFIQPGTGLRLNDAKGTAVDDQAQGQYWVIDGHHYNSGCCFDYGNGEIDSRDDGNGTMETTFYGNTPWWYYGEKPGPWVMTDQENNLVGCVTPDKSKFCPDLPSIEWRFVTAMAKGKPHHWSTLGGDAQKGPLTVMFDGPRIDATYDPMRKQGAIVLGNGGDNSNGSQGTFYEGVMTAPNTYPGHDTDQQIQANVVAARYDVGALTVSAPGASEAATGLQTFVPGGTKETTVTFRNTTGAAVRGLTLSLKVPAGWTAVAKGAKMASKRFPEEIAPGASVEATFLITTGTSAYNGDIVGQAVWTAPGNPSVVAIEKARSAPAIKINEFRIGDGSLENASNAFIELYNAGPKPVDISNWTLTQHQAQDAIFSTITVPANTKVGAKGFYLLGLSNSGLATKAVQGASTLQVRDVSGMKTGDTIRIGAGANEEARQIASLGTASGKATTIWQPLPEGPVITIPAGSNNIPVTSVAGIVEGQQIALGYGASYPAVGREREQYETVTVTHVGKSGTQAYIATDARVGDTRLQVTSVENLTVGDQIRLDIDSLGHGIETVTIKSIGTAVVVSALKADARKGDTSLILRSVVGAPVRAKLDFHMGGQLVVGMPDSYETLTVTGVEPASETTVKVHFATPLKKDHITEEDVIQLGTGIALGAPLKFNHAANLPFSARGTGVTFTPATRFAHGSNEPVLPLGTGIALDRPLERAHDIDAVVQVAGVKTAGFQGVPNQWFGGPVLSPNAGNMVLRDGKGVVVDSLNYGASVDPWAGEGFQNVSGFEKMGCFVPAPGGGIHWEPANGISAESSAGRFPDGQDSDSNCTDFKTPATAVVQASAAAGANHLFVDQVKGFAAGQSLTVDVGPSRDAAKVISVGSPGATNTTAELLKGETVLQVHEARDFQPGQEIIIDASGKAEAAVVSEVRRWEHRIILQAPLQSSHPSGTSVTGTGITLSSALEHTHDVGSQVTSDLPTPGKPNVYSARAEK